MGECGVVPTPDNFELFYIHAAGENPGLSQAIAGMLAQKKSFTPDALQDLAAARAHRRARRWSRSAGACIRSSPACWAS